MQNVGEGVAIRALSALSSSSSRRVLPILPAVLLAPPSPVSRCHHRHPPPLPTIVVVSLSLSAPCQLMVVVPPHRCSPFPPRKQSLTVVVGGAAVVSVCSCYFVIVIVVVLIPHVPISCLSFPVLLSLVVPPLSLPLPTYSPCEQGLAAVVVDGGVVGCCPVA